MNFHNRVEGGGREAKLHFLPGDYNVVTPGSFVRCSITGKPVPLEDLRYWSAEMQEAYASADIAVARYEQLRAEGKV